MHTVIVKLARRIQEEESKRETGHVRFWTQA